MISSKCFTTEWIEKKSVELKYKDKNLIEKVITNVEHYDGNPASLIGLTLSPRLHTKLNKLKMNNPEAFFYWAKLGEVYSKLEE